MHGHCQRSYDFLTLTNGFCGFPPLSSLLTWPFSANSMHFTDMLFTCVIKFSVFIKVQICFQNHLLWTSTIKTAWRHSENMAFWNRFKYWNSALKQVLLHKAQNVKDFWYHITAVVFYGLFFSVFVYYCDL